MRTLPPERPALPTAVAHCRYGVLHWPKDDEILGRSLGQYGEWAQGEIDLLLRFLRPNADVVDVGAFVGTHTIAFAAQAVDGCTVHACEAHPDYVQILEANLKANGFKSVKVHPVALSDHRGHVVLQAGPVSSQTNFGGARFGDDVGQGETLSVPAVRLDRLTLGSCSLVKIDAEGMELRVLRGAEETLRSHRPVVYTECNAAAEGWPVVQHMSARGYLCWLFCFAAFNPANFRGSTENFFGAAREVGLLFLPQERISQGLGQLIVGEPLAPVQSVDDLLLGMLRKPQYKHEVLSRGPAALVLGVDFWLNEPEAQQLRQALKAAQIAGQNADEAQRLATERLQELEQLHASRSAVEEALQASRADAGRLQAALDTAQGLAVSRHHELQSLGGQLDRTQAALDTAQGLAVSRHQELTETRNALAAEVERSRRVTSSIYWRAVAPLRWLARFMQGKARAD